MPRIRDIEQGRENGSHLYSAQPDALAKTKNTFDNVLTGWVSTGEDRPVVGGWKNSFLDDHGVVRRAVRARKIPPSGSLFPNVDLAARETIALAR